MSTATTNKKIILKGFPYLSMQEIVAGAISPCYTFNNTKSVTCKLPAPSTSSSSSDNLDIVRSDGAIIRFPKTSLVLSGIDESDITPAAASSDATGKCEIDVVLNEAAVETNSMTAMFKALKEKRDSLWLVTIATGLSHEAETNATLRKPDGFVHMIGKISNDIEQQYADAPTTLALNFVSYTNSGLDEAKLTGVVFTPVTWKKGGTGKDVTAITPPAITSEGAANLLAGDCEIVTNITYV